MKVNQGNVDRALRLVAAGVLIGMGLGLVQGPEGIAMAAVGVIPLATGLSGFCPLYALLGIDTSHRRVA